MPRNESKSPETAPNVRNGEPAVAAAPRTRKVPVEFGVVFPYGAYAVGEISPVRDYDRSTRENPVQATDPDTGLPVWAVDVVALPAERP